MNLVISTDIFVAFLNCKYKAYLKAIGESGTPSEYEAMETSLAEEYRVLAARRLVTKIPDGRIVESPKSIKRAIQRGFHAITNACVVTKEFEVRFDALLRTCARRESRPEYVPILFTASERVSKYHKLLLTFNSIALSHVQGHPTRFGKIIHGESFRNSRVQTDRMTSIVEQFLEEIRNTKAPPFRLNEHCRICEFRVRCRRLAVEKDDLSLLRGLREKEIKKLNNKGIFTTTQLSYTFKPRRRRRARKQRPARHNHALQALAIRTGTTYVEREPKLPACETPIYVDIERVPDRDFYYLIGVHIVAGDNENSFSLWADTEKDEPKIWASFLRILQCQSEFVILHFGAYDARAISVMSQRYGGDRALIEKLLGSCTNVLSLIYGHICFPTYSNDLKSVSSWLGFQWSDDDPSGAKSLIWRHRWEDSRDELLKDKLLTYNREDCFALRAVMEALSAILESQTGSGEEAPMKVVNAQQFERGWPNNYRQNEFYLPDLDRVNRCAYFDYQRDRVLVRTSQTAREAAQRKTRRGKRHVKVNRIVEYPRPSQCPNCLAKHVIRHEAVSKTVHDLKILDGGIRRWVVKHVAQRYLCKNCGCTFQPKEFPASRYGKILRAWSVYQNIGLLRSHGSIVDDMRELFGYQYTQGLAATFKSAAARYYEPTYRQLMDRIRTGNLVHVDETKVSIKGVTRYVWVFTNLDDVAYVYSDTRERATLDTILDGFNGVLVSDFYPAYDSVDCPQQKCLIHIIRDINDDLFKNPFDEELEKLAAALSKLLVGIVETVDQYGLKRRHLNKHRADVERFFKYLLISRFSSELAQDYERRLLKNRGKLFTFLALLNFEWVKLHAG